MNRRMEARVVLVTCGSLAEGRKIAKAVVGKRLAACVNIISAPAESIYRWKGKIQTAKEFLLIVKTTARRVNALEKEIKRMHSYDLPELLALEIKAGSRDYLKWLSDAVLPTTD